MNHEFKIVIEPNSTPFTSNISYWGLKTSPDQDLSLIALFCAEKFKLLLYEILKKVQGLKPYLFMINSVWLPPTPTSRYKKLWKGRENPCWLPVDQCSFGEEIEFQSQDGIRFASIVQFPPECIVSALTFLRLQHCALIMLSDKQDFLSKENTSNIVANYFQKENGELSTDICWQSLVEDQSLKECEVLIRTTGKFDDPDTTIDLFFDKNSFLWHSTIMSLSASLKSPNNNNNRALTEAEGSDL